MRLIEGELGKSYRIRSIERGCVARMRMVSLGIVPGVIVKLKRKAPLRGPIVVEVDGSNVVVGRGIASKIIVEEMNGS